MILYLRVLNIIYAKVFSCIFSRRFASFGQRTSVVFPVAIEGVKNIHLGRDVYIAAQTCLAANPLTDVSSCSLEIGNGCRIGRFNHIYATGRVVLEDHVLTANGVYISDNQHEYRNIEIPILQQSIIQKKFVTIGSGSWLGHNVCVMGASVGRNCTIGANSVVTRDIPDYCVAVGSPARIVKRFDQFSGQWKSTREDGSFVI